MIHVCAEWYRFVQNGTGLCRMVQVCAEWYRFVQNATGLCRMLQFSVNWCILMDWFSLVHFDIHNNVLFGTD